MRTGVRDDLLLDCAEQGLPAGLPPLRSAGGHRWALPHVQAAQGENVEAPQSNASGGPHVARQPSL